MKRLYIVSTIVIFASAPAFAAAEKYNSTPAEQSILRDSYSARFNHAVASLDHYRGDTSSLEAARAELESVLKEKPRYAPAYRELARYAIMSGHINYKNFQPGSLEAAESSIKKAIEISPNYAEAYVLLGHVYGLMNRHQDAVAALEQAKKLGTKDPWLQNNWADLLIDEGKYEEAAQLYRQVVDSKTSNKKAMGSALEGLIKYYKAVGKLDQADEIYRKQLEFEPDAAWGYGNYAQFLLCQKDDYEQSIKRSRQALSIMNYGAGRYMLAAALYRKWAQSVISGVPDSGKPYFTEAQTLYPDLHEIVTNNKNCSPLNHIKEALALSNKGAPPELRR
ncbi:tetratricopeptide repeat protein [Paraherbaspirillum soli]|uniref:Tetratricopeptide repeat protein n=1 Tax=Paraherbaspirillum soli TaxID=631222 RepID=A0ABW0MDD0_9BURK